MIYKMCFAAALALALGGCSSASLVGADELPSDARLASETIEVRVKSRGDDSGAHRVLRMQIAPNNAATVATESIRVNDYGEPPIVVLESEKTGQLTAPQAAQARRTLAPLHPSKLGPEWPFAFLSDCPSMSSHPDVVLVAEFRKTAKEGGLFLLERRCDSDQSAQALRLAEAFRSQLPVQVDYPRIAK